MNDYDDNDDERSNPIQVKGDPITFFSLACQLFREFLWLGEFQIYEYVCIFWLDGEEGMS